MTTVPGTYFTEEQLEADLKVNNISGGDRSGSNRMTQIGVEYENEKQQYDKALAWYILAAKENHSIAQNNIGVLYYYGHGVLQNYLCALKWFLKAAQQNNVSNTSNNIGDLFEYGRGVSLDKYKALEWYCHGGDKTYRNSMKAEGYHRSGEDKKKSLQQLIKETEAILEFEKKKLEEKKYKTQEETEALEQLKIAYKITGVGKNAWEGVPILLAESKQQDEDEVSTQKKQNQLLEQKEKEMQDLSNQHQSLKQEKSILQLRIKELDRQLSLIESENATLEHQLETKNKTISSLESENQSLKLERSDLDQQIKTKENKINLLENEKRQYRTTSMQQTQILDTLKQEKQMIEQSKMDTINEMERLKSSYATLEQLLKSKEDIITALNRENQGNQQGTNEMVGTLKSLLQAKANETELLKQNMEHVLDKEKKKNRKLQKEIERLKQRQHQQTREESSSNNATFPEAAISNARIDGNDPNNDINYDTDCGTEYSSSDDTSSEDGDNTNDFNYDSDD